jgi:hypothetical protein
MDRSIILAAKFIRSHFQTIGDREAILQSPGLATRIREVIVRIVSHLLARDCSRDNYFAKNSMRTRCDRISRMEHSAYLGQA